MPEDNTEGLYAGPERRQTQRGIAYRNVISLGQILTLLGMAGTVSVFIFVTGQKYSDLMNIQTRDREERIATVQRERDDRIASVAAEVAARIAAENLLRAETTAAINAVSAKLDASAMLAARETKNTSDSLLELKEHLKTLVAASSQTRR